MPLSAKKFVSCVETSITPNRPATPNIICLHIDKNPTLQFSNSWVVCVETGILPYSSATPGLYAYRQVSYLTVQQLQCCMRRDEYPTLQFSNSRVVCVETGILPYSPATPKMSA